MDPLAYYVGIYFFEVGCDDLRPGEEARLMEELRLMGRAVHFKVHGFASEEGSKGFNRELACHRARKVTGLIRAASAGAGIADPVTYGATPGDRPSRRSVVVEMMMPPQTKAMPRTPGCEKPSNPNLWDKAHNPTTDGERWNAFKNPVEAVVAHDARNEAVAAAAASGLPGFSYGPQDAFRHCTWSCLMQKQIGDVDAEKFGTAHENSGRSAIPWNNEMDLHNNAVGRSLEALRWSLCTDFCQFALESGMLRTLRGPEADRSAKREGLAPSRPSVGKTCIGASDQPWP